MRRSEMEKLRHGESQKREEDAGARKVGKSRNTVFFPMVCGSGESKSRLAKAAGVEPSGQMRNENLHVFVARSIFGSQNAQSTSGSDRFWKLRRGKSASGCGAKHIWKSTCANHHTSRCRPDVEKVHAVVAPSTFGSQSVKKVKF